MEAHGPYEGQVGTPIAMSGTIEYSPSGDDLSYFYTWRIDDPLEYIGSGQTITHVFPETGSYSGTMEGSVLQGTTVLASGTDTFTVLVYGAPIQPGTFLQVYDDFERDNNAVLGARWAETGGDITLTAGKAASNN